MCETVWKVGAEPEATDALPTGYSGKNLSMDMLTYTDEEKLKDLPLNMPALGRNPPPSSTVVAHVCEKGTYYTAMGAL